MSWIFKRSDSIFCSSSIADLSNASSVSINAISSNKVDNSAASDLTFSLSDSIPANLSSSALSSSSFCLSRLSFLFSLFSLATFALNTFRLCSAVILAAFASSYAFWISDTFGKPSSPITSSIVLPSAAAFLANISLFASLAAIANASCPAIAVSVASASAINAFRIFLFIVSISSAPAPVASNISNSLSNDPMYS